MPPARSAWSMARQHPTMHQPLRWAG